MAKTNEEKKKCLYQVPKIQKKLLSKDHAKKRAEYLKLLSHPTRLQILRLLSKQDLCVCVFAESLGKSQPNISQHLAKLKDNNVIESYYVGKLVFYKLRDNNIRKILKLL
jgi:DNA-binding transcriptional ArsR family regulator